MKQIDTLVAFLDKASKASKNEETIKAFEDIINKNIKNAKSAMADNEEKYAILVDVLTRWINQLAFALFREGSLTEDIEKEYRTLTSVDDTTAAAKAYSDARQEKINEINTAHAEIIREQKGIDIFKAVVGGEDLETAKAKMEEYDKQLEQAQKQAMGA